MKIVLAYSGGLDTSVMIPWLKENYPGCEVIAYSANVGQGDFELEGIEEKAIASGASKIYVEDIQEELVNDYIAPFIKAGATYENSYLLGTAFSRPLIAKKLVEVAHKEGAQAICHGCTGKGNDQIRFEMGIKHFDPDMEVIVPWRVWEITGREEAYEYAMKHNISLKFTKESSYSKDKNIFHLSHEGLDLEDPANAPKYDEILEMGVTPEKAPDEPTMINIGFFEGLPTSIDEEQMSLLEIIKKLNTVGGENGIGILDMVENRLVGMKSRGVYETPGGTIIHKAHELLESICLDKDLLHEKQHMALKIGELLYNAKFYSPLMDSYLAFTEKASENVSGNVKLKLYKGNIICMGIESPNSLHSLGISSFENNGDYDQYDAKGFVNIYSLSNRIMAKKLGGK